jgi:arginase family enzyme
MDKDEKKKVFLIFNPFDAYGDVGGGEGVSRLYSRISSYLSVKDDRNKVYRFFDYRDRFVTEFLSPNIHQYSSSDEHAKSKLSSIIGSSRHFIYFGGNHLSILPILHYYKEQDSRTLFLTFDSHIDAAPASLLGRKWGNHEVLDISNYLSPFIEKSSPIEFVHIGSKHPLKDGILDDLNITIYTIQDLLLHNECYVQTRLDQVINHHKLEFLHIDIDIDILDHSVMRATYDPSSMGLTLNQLLRLICCAIDKLPLVSVDIVGYIPRIDPHIDHEEVCLRLFENILYLIMDSKVNASLWF